MTTTKVMSAITQDIKNMTAMQSKVPLRLTHAL
jgi:hypothetical protein